MKIQLVSTLFLLTRLVTGGNALRCYVSEGSGPREEQTVKDPTGADAAHGFCFHMSAEEGQNHTEIRGWIGWREEDNELVRRCLTENGIEAGACVTGPLDFTCEGNRHLLNSFTNSTGFPTVHLLEPKLTSCFCDEDLCNDSLVGPGPGCPDCETVTTTVTVTSTSTTTTEVKTCKSQSRK